MNEKEKKEELKINVPIFNNLELAELDGEIELNLNEFVNRISKTVAKDRDIIVLKKVIEKQAKEIEELKNNELDYTTIYINGVYEGKKFYKDKIREIKNKLKNKVKEIGANELSEIYNDDDWQDTQRYNAQIDILERLEEG